MAADCIHRQSQRISCDRDVDSDTPGGAEHAWKLDAPWQAHLFHRKLVNACFGANPRMPHCDEALNIAIVGAGATGVELAAELRHATRVLAGYGLRNLDADRHIRIALIEAGPRILPNLAEKLSDSVTGVLAKLCIEVRTGVQVTRVNASEIQCSGGVAFAADLVVWAAGIRPQACCEPPTGSRPIASSVLVVRVKLH